MRILPVRVVLAAVGARRGPRGAGAASSPDAVATIAGRAGAMSVAGVGGGTAGTDPCDLATPEMVATALRWQFALVCRGTHATALQLPELPTSTLTGARIVAGDTVYSVSGGFGASDEVNADVAELATAIAGTLGG